VASSASANLEKKTRQEVSPETNKNEKEKRKKKKEKTKRPLHIPHVLRRS
jgi:hypothetical protein